MILAVILVILFIIFLITSGLIIYARWNYGTLERIGIPVIPPKSFLGSVPDLHTKVQSDEDIQNFQKYGNIWGLYEGRSPLVFICDPELIRLIFMKDLDHFFDRRVKHMNDPRIDEILDFLPGEKWRVLRQMQTVLFSSRKIKQYSKSLVSAAQDFSARMRRDVGQTETGRLRIDTRYFLDMLSLDEIFRVGFSAKLENMDDPKNTFFQALKKLMGQGQEYNWVYSLSMVFPWLSKFAPTFQFENVIFDTYKELLQIRRQERDQPSQSYRDFADFLVDLYQKLETPEFKSLEINEMTILAQTLNLTALDMFAPPMSAMLYYLAQNPTIQEKVFDEINGIINEKYDGIVNTETVNELPYLMACINETLRLVPPLLRLERECNMDWSSPDGSLKIKKGTIVNVPVWATNRNPEYFPDPERFVPERFLDHKFSPYVFSPFGLGPRFCIGMRLALETLKVNMCVMLKDFRFELRPDSQLRFKPGVLLLTQFYPLYLDVTCRN